MGEEKERGGEGRQEEEREGKILVVLDATGLFQSKELTQSKQGRVYKSLKENVNIGNYFKLKIIHSYKN